MMMTEEGVEEPSKSSSSLNGSAAPTTTTDFVPPSPPPSIHAAAIPIVPVVKDYAWGIRGMDSRVGRYALECSAIDHIDPDCPYAELWIGTHPNGPAQLLVLQEQAPTQAAAAEEEEEDSNKEATKTTTKQHTTKMMDLKEAIGDELPFLFKILSAGKALSIQAHPDKDGAVRLHNDDPVNYGDANHKPEMAIALTPFEAMCGFRRIHEISVLIKKHPEFAACLTETAKLAVFLASTEEQEKLALQQMFHSFMTCDPVKSERQLQLLLLRLQAEQAAVHPHPHDEPPWERKCARAILRLAQQFPNDAGAMAPFFLNYLLMAPGESFFMAANEPHAYVAGEIIECMACSDNVVRAGLTPKFKDVQTLVDMLTYSTGGPSIDAGAPMAEDHRILRYTPPVPEFEVLIVTVDPGDTLTLPHIDVPAVFVIVEGAGILNDTITCQPGRCYYHPANAPALQFAVKSEQRGCLKVAVAHKNLHLHIPTTFSRTPNTSACGSAHHSPYEPSSPMSSTRAYRGMAEALAALHHGGNNKGATASATATPPFLQGKNQWK